MTGSSKSKDRTAGAHRAGVSIPKPYTEYTIFFRLERARILQQQGIIDEETVQSLDPSHADDLEFPRPAGYEKITMPPFWYSSSHKAVVEKKRKHRKREGRMDLKTMSKTISASWRNAPPEVVHYCRRLARGELERYNGLMEKSLGGKKAQAKNKATKAPKGAASEEGDGRGDGPGRDLEPGGLRGGAGDTGVPDLSGMLGNDWGNNFTGSNANQGQVQPTNEALIMMQLQQQLRTVHQAALNNGMDISPTSANMNNIFASNSGSALGAPLMPASGGLAGLIPPPLQPNVKVPEKKRKAYVRRASAPPEFTGLKPPANMNTEVQAYMAPMSYASSMDTSGHSNDSSMPHNDNIDNNVFLCEQDLASLQPPPKMNPGQKMRRRVSMTDMTAQHAAELQALRAQHGRGAHRISMSSAEDGGVAPNFIEQLRREMARGASAGSTDTPYSNQGEPLEALKREAPQSHFDQAQEFARGGEFSCVPSNWGSEDASTLLDMLGGEAQEAFPLSSGSADAADLSPPALDWDTSVGQGMLALLKEGTAEPESGPVKVGNVLFG
ncbi:hypothetical protein ACHAXT_009430 [Thalassiosira profunda]